MSTLLWASVFLAVIAVGRLDNAEDARIIEEDLAFVKAIYDDVQRTRQQLSRSGYSAEKCYEDIGCFSPTTGIVDFSNLYPDPPERIDTKFRLYTKHNINSHESMDYLDRNTLTTTLFNPEVPIVFIVHGMNEHGLITWMIKMKNELLKSKDVNVITIDWEKGAPLPYYGQGIVNSELVSRQVARLLVLLKEMRGYDIKKTHMIGYSLGAHLSGFTSKYLQQLGEGKMARITGLDPAGPTFEEKDERVHLSYNDAEFVDVIHTSAGGSIITGNVGITKAIGQADFYPNGGKDQPGCGFFQFVCHHRRAPLLFLETINSDCEYMSSACTGYSEFNAGLCSEKRAKLGYYSYLDNPKGVFYLNTTGTPPYC